MLERPISFQDRFEQFLGLGRVEGLVSGKDPLFGLQLSLPKRFWF